MADASHELRTPVTSLRTNVEVLRDAPAMGEGDRRALLDDVVEQAEELGNLVGDLIALARDGEAPPATEDVRLDELVAEAVVRARRHAPAVSFTLRAEPVRGQRRARPHRARGQQPARQRRPARRPRSRSR